MPWAWRPLLWWEVMMGEVLGSDVRRRQLQGNVCSGLPPKTEVVFDSVDGRAVTADC